MLSVKYWTWLFFLCVFLVGIIAMLQVGIFNDYTLSIFGIPYSVNPLGICVYSVFGLLLIEKWNNLAILFFFFSIGYTELQYNFFHIIFEPNSLYQTIYSPNWSFFLAFWILLVCFPMGILMPRMKISWGYVALLPCSVFGILVYLTYQNFTMQVLSGLMTLCLLYWGFEPRNEKMHNNSIDQKS